MIHKYLNIEYSVIFECINVVYINPIRSGVFQTANDPGGGGNRFMLTLTYELDTVAYYTTLIILHIPPPTISKTVVSIFTISYICILLGVLGMFQLDFSKIRDFDHFTTISK